MPRNWTRDTGGTVHIAGRYDDPDIQLEGSQNFEILVTLGRDDGFFSAYDLAEGVCAAAALAGLNLAVLDLEDPAFTDLLARAIPDDLLADPALRVAVVNAITDALEAKARRDRNPLR